MEDAMSTKERILDEALTLFSQNGYDGTSVEQIAEKVGIKAPSLYKHFRGKEDILNAIIGLTVLNGVCGADVEEFDKDFPHKEKLKLPGQIF